MTQPHAAAPSNASEERPRVVAGWRGARAWLLALAPGAFGVGLFALGRMRPEAVERIYSREWYPRIADAVGISGRVWNRAVDGSNLATWNVSASELLVVVLAGLALWRLIAAARGGVVRFVRLALLLAGTAYASFVLTWGLNHARLPLADTLGLDDGPGGIEALYTASLTVHQDLVELLDAADERRASADLGVDYDLARAGSDAVEIWREAIAREPELGKRRKLSVLAPAASPLLVKSSIAGIFSPFTQECHVAFGMGQDDVLFTACHELAHAQGWAREDEANYLAWRVASRSGRPAFEEAAHLIVLRHLHRAAARYEPVLASLILSGFDDRVLERLGQRAEFWARKRSKTASRAASKVNDTYLKSQGQAEGVVSYGRMVDLILAERQ